MIYSEYIQYMRSLIDSDAPKGVRKIATLVHNNFDTLLPLTTAQRQRINKIIELALKSWDTIDYDIKIDDQLKFEKAARIESLNRLIVGPFRGFAQEESFDLSSDLVLIYGQNGTGKSSFCEALEFALLGNVSEAKSNRFHNVHDYYNNAHTKSFEVPKLFALDNQGNEIQVTPEESLFRFCFVEKNRIDNFSRIAAHTPAKQNELISTLFGMDDFTEFVRNFTVTMEQKHIDLEGTNAKKLNTKQQSLASYEEQLRTTIPEELTSIQDTEKEIAEAYKSGWTIDQVQKELMGDDEDIGLIRKLDADLQTRQPQKNNLTIASLLELDEKLKDRIKELFKKQGEFSSQSREVSFKKLYRAIIDVQANAQETCPACKTPIESVVVNPFENASSELIELEHLSNLEGEIHTLEKNINRLLMSVYEILIKCCNVNTENNPLNELILASEDQVTTEWWNLLQNNPDKNPQLWEQLKKQVTQIELEDKAIEQAERERKTKQTELERCRDISKQIDQLNTRKEAALKLRESATKKIDDFKSENDDLIIAVENEKEEIIKHKSIAASYNQFVASLNDFKSKLPKQLVSDLGHTVVELYNAFNRNDKEFEKLASIKLPLLQNERLLVSFQDRPDDFYDALHYLSEGHVRCIGLAILCAKNIKENCPFIIFDDPVNSIDDEHRSSIRQTFFKDRYFNGKQLVIAIHGEEFFNNIHQLIGKEAASSAQSYIFSQRENNHIVVNSMNRPKNHVLAARKFLDSSEYRDSLMSSRRALEVLSEQTWNHYAKYCDKKDSPISVVMRVPNLPWDLRALIENLKIKFRKSQAEIPNKEHIINALTYMLGPNAIEPPWKYLNKGTHIETDLPEFEDQIVIEIVEALEILDSVVNKNRV